MRPVLCKQEQGFVWGAISSRAGLTLYRSHVISPNLKKWGATTARHTLYIEIIIRVITIFPRGLFSRFTLFFSRPTVYHSTQSSSSHGRSKLTSKSSRAKHPGGKRAAILGDDNVVRYFVDISPQNVHELP